MLSSFDGLSEDELREIDAETRRDAGRQDWFPNPGPQLDAYESEADELFYGGAAGGGKTDLLLGLARYEHDNALILRREATDLRAIIARLIEIEGDSEHFNQTLKLWKLGQGRTIELGSCKNENDKFGYQGRPHDLKAFDEITQFTRSQYQYIIGWNRPALESGRGRRCRVVAAGNPPSTPEGYWVVEAWAPWLKPDFKEPAEPGELRWFTTDDETGDTIWVDEDYEGRDEDGHPIYPRSRSFIPALMSDNPHLGADYRATIAAMPEPLRTQLMRGDFNVARRDQVNQVFPSAWVRAAMDRWDERGRAQPMVSLGCDAAGGDTEEGDKAAFAPRHIGDWYDDVQEMPGREFGSGADAAAIAIGMVLNGAGINIDMGGGYGSSMYDHLKDNNVEAWRFNGADGATRTAPISGLRFANMRAQAHWMFRCALDPKSGREVSLFPDEQLFADLCAPTWKLTPRGILIEDKKDVRKKIGRSPNKGDAVIIASADPVDDVAAEARVKGRAMKQRLKRHGRTGQPRRKAYDPMDSLDE